MDTYYRPPWARIVPESPALSLLLCALFSAGVGIGDVLIATHVAGDYGWSLFIITPAAMSVLAPLLHGLNRPPSFPQCLLAAGLSQVALFGGVIIFAIDGIICIIMAAPIWMTFATVGAVIAWAILRALWSPYQFSRGFPVAGLILVLIAPLCMAGEHIAAPDAPTYVLTSSIEIDAPAERVWANLIEFPDIDEPRSLFGRVGIAAPIRAELHGTGIGATRYCVFTTGRATEPIDTWNPPYELAFNVTTTPPPMQEWSIYPDLHPPHLQGFFVSERARFELFRLPGNRTRLVGTSWYKNRLYPLSYWKLWSDAVVRDIHESVFDHIKRLSEQGASASGRAEYTGR